MGQNVLKTLTEVAHLAGGIMAAELGGADIKLQKEQVLLHDLG